MKIEQPSYAVEKNVVYHFDRKLELKLEESNKDA